MDQEPQGGVYEFLVAGRQFSAASLTVVADWDADEDNLAEDQVGALPA